MTATDQHSEQTTIVVGASRGLGRGIATAFAQAGAPVIAVARTQAALAELAASTGAGAGAGAARSTTKRGRPSRPTGIPMSGSRSTGCARLCSSRLDPAAE